MPLQCNAMQCIVGLAKRPQICDFADATKNCPRDNRTPLFSQMNFDLSLGWDECLSQQEPPPARHLLAPHDNNSLLEQLVQRNYLAFLQPVYTTLQHMCEIAKQSLNCNACMVALTVELASSNVCGLESEQNYCKFYGAPFIPFET